MKDIHFSNVRDTILDYANQKKTDSQRVLKSLTLSLHYNLDMGTKEKKVLMVTKHTKFNIS